MIGFFARHPTAANLLMILFLFIGLLSLDRLRRETFPDYMPTEIEIRILYPGATAEDVEEAVCRRIEDALDRVKYVKELRADARENVAIVTVEMEEEGDPLTFRSDIETEVNAIDDFPADIEDPVITQLHTAEMVLSLLVAGDLTPPELKAYSENLKRRLQSLPEISLVTLLGFSDRRLRVELESDRLLAFGLSVSEVADRIARQSINLPAGSVRARERDILIRFVEERRSALELEDLVIVSGRGGADVRLGDLGRVTDTFEFDEDKVLLGNRRAAQLRVEGLKSVLDDRIELEEISAGQWTESDGIVAFNDWYRVARARDPRIHVVAGGNDELALGARRACEALSEPAHQAHPRGHAEAGGAEQGCGLHLDVLRSR